MYVWWLCSVLAVQFLNGSVSIFQIWILVFGPVRPSPAFQFFRAPCGYAPPSACLVSVWALNKYGVTHKQGGGLPWFVPRGHDCPDCPDYQGNQCLLGGILSCPAIIVCLSNIDCPLLLFDRSVGYIYPICFSNLHWMSPRELTHDDWDLANGEVTHGCGSIPLLLPICER